MDKSDAGLDADQDGLSNLQEFQSGSAADTADTDGDNVNDGVEVAEGRNPVMNEDLIIQIINSSDN